MHFPLLCLKSSKQASSVLVRPCLVQRHIGHMHATGSVSLSVCVCVGGEGGCHRRYNALCMDTCSLSLSSSLILSLSLLTKPWLGKFPLDGPKTGFNPWCHLPGVHDLCFQRSGGLTYR